LEEVSLHQQNIERFERLDQLCRNIQILYLQNNLIARIERKCARRLRELKYLNMAVNNVTLVEGLDNCEFLEKIDFTVNFLDVEGLLSFETLSQLAHLKEVYLTGNPCTRLDGYRLFMIHTLPKLERLDGTNVSKSERIQAAQVHAELRRRFVRLAQERELRGEWKKPVVTNLDDYEVSDSDEEPDEADESVDAELHTSGAMRAKKEEKKKSFCPQTRIEDAKKTLAQQAKAEESKKKSSVLNDYGEPVEEADPEKRVPRPEQGCAPSEVRQRNEGKHEFEFGEDDNGKITLNIKCCFQK
jgi:protein TilB